MKTNDGYELSPNSKIWVSVKRGDNPHKPEQINMYSPIGTGRYWFYEKSNCQKECDKLNNKQ